MSQQRDWKTKRKLALRMFLCLWFIGGIFVKAQNTSGAGTPQGSDSQKTPWQKSFAIAPSFSWVESTQNQTNPGGTTLFSDVRSRSFCDKKTMQFGVVGSASDSTTSSPGSASTLIASNDVRADFMSGILGEPDPKPGDTSGHKPTTNNYVSVYADMFMNNSLGVGLQQEYVVNYQRYLMKECISTEKARRFYSSATAGIGFINQRLYKTAARLNSIAIPISAQLTYVITNRNIPPDQQKWPPPMLLSAQAGYTAMPNASYAYQAFVNASLTVPTPYKNVTLSLNDLDVYMNNSPTGFKRNYQSGSVQVAFSWGGSAKASGSYPGACYTADTLNHLYCYDGVAASECSSPGVFRPKARCSDLR
jgi:hypothetical protein